MTDDKKKKDDDKKHEKKHAHGEGPVLDAKVHAEEKKKPAGDGKKGGRKEKAPATIQAAQEEAAAKGEQPPRLNDSYKEQIIPALMKDFVYKNHIIVTKVRKDGIHSGQSVGIPKQKRP